MDRRSFLKTVGMGLAASHLEACHRMTSGLGKSSRRPNVVLVLTDDQGYGDLGCHGNPWLKTPNIDALYGESLRLTDFHVCPLCSPTRASLLTGRHCRHVGVTGTNNCTNFIAREVPTIANIFAANGYRTGQFGKWHLGDHYPNRPHDRGFQEAIYHGDGAITSVGDTDWRNHYFDDVYEHNGRKRKFEGYCTDIWFREAMRFIESSGDTPFFCYLPTNAPHAPYLVDKKYSEPYAKFASEIWHPEYYGMIANIDENMGRLMALLKAKGLEENTILIFMTDNGSVGNNFNYPDPQDPYAYRPVLSEKTASGKPNPAELAQGYNAGMRSQKGSPYDGGHRVPFFIRWPGGRLQGGRDIHPLAAHIDVLPTLVDLCGLNLPKGVAFDGLSLKPILQSPEARWPERTIVESFSGAVMTPRWRLVHGEELYDIQADPQQLRDVARQHPDVVQALRAELERCRAKDVPTDPRIVIGLDQDQPVRLCTEQWLGLAQGFDKRDVVNGSPINGHLRVSAAQDGTYEFTLMRWPEELNLPLGGAIPGGKALKITHAQLKVNDRVMRQAVTGDMNGVTFSLPLKAGDAKIETSLAREDGSASGAYYVYVRRRVPVR